MPYQYKREPLTQDEATRLANSAETHQEKLIVWTLLDTGLRVAELAGLKKDNIIVQDLIAHSKETNPRRRSRDYLFLHGRLQCVCGRVMSGYYDGHHQRRRYRCTRKQYPRCGRIGDAEWIEAQGWSVVEALMEPDPRYVEMELRRRSTTQQYTYRHADLESSKQSIEKEVIEMQRLDRAYLAGAFELSRFTELKALINRELSQLRHLQDKMQEDLDRQRHRDEEIQAAIEFIAMARDEISTYDLAQRARGRDA
jgi:hypothetical protein